MANKKRFAALLLLITAISLTGKAQAPQQSVVLEDPDWVKELAPKRIVYVVPGMEQVKVRKDLTYKRVAGAELKMDVYSPAKSQSRAHLPAVIFIHGGRVPSNLRTTPKDWGDFISYGQLVAASGFVGVTFNHRFYAWESFSDSQSDLNELIIYLREHADSLGIDKDRIILWAFSAGAIFLSQAIRDAPPYMRCLLSFYGELDLRNQRKAAPATVSDETLREFSPLYYLGSDFSDL